MDGIVLWLTDHEKLYLQTSFQDLLQKQNGERALWEYPFAVAGVNITFMLIQMLDLQLARTLMNFCNDCSQTQVVYCSCLSEVTFSIFWMITAKLSSRWARCKFQSLANSVMFLKLVFMLIKKNHYTFGLFFDVHVFTYKRMTLSLVTENDQAFDIMYCITFKLMDHQWLTMHASYMDFNVCYFIHYNKS
ncbi:hypothetical protein ZIOFF_028542 [Zingiber officinale]|uniref:ELMO domain-containing protein n=1 Tax=Zingiber officinale TaxID=94328 RepID=A0A8J5GS75_ZINOF|nr:hypothetical protein ZIOFF_028542 [Zingiber officinale]